MPHTRTSSYDDTLATGRVVADSSQMRYGEITDIDPFVTVKAEDVRNI